MVGQGANPFWDFSVDVYGRDGVATACLALQDRHGIDVNLVLFCLWAGHRGHAVTAAELARLMTVTRSWQQDVIAPLRAVRRYLKTAQPAAGPLRDRVKAAELTAEEVEQQMLFGAIPIAAEKGAPGLAGSNMIAYLKDLGVAVDAVDVTHLATILHGGYPDLPPLQAVWAVTG
ncbi:MAG: TIGR02444 family protein [Alphaproteobacteria bacterium]